MLKLSPDEAALLKAVCADRDNDLPRLVYADWLDDHGRPERAEFIRLQVRVAVERSRYIEYHVQSRMDELHAANQDRWRRELPKWSLATLIPPFVRGFMQSFTFPAGPFLSYGPQLLDRTPVRSLGLRSLGRVIDDLVRCPWLREVPAIDLSGEQLGDANAAEVARSDWLIGTQTLNLESNDLGDPAARALAGCRNLSELTELRLRSNRLSRAGLETLLASPYLRGCTLRVGSNPRLDADLHNVLRLLGPRGTL